MKNEWFCAIFATYLHVFAGAMYNGEYRSITDFPYMVQLHYQFENEQITGCGASILSEYWIISAAHCVGIERTVTSQVRIGSSAAFQSGILIDVEQFYVHGDYHPDYAYDNDIALIKLKTPITFNEYQQPVKIAKESPKIDENITVLGFGNHHHSVLGQSIRAAQTSVIEDKLCFDSYESNFTKNQICTSIKNIDLCHGDSGGPAMYNDKLIGIISQGCEYTKPNILTKVSNYYDWILQTTGIKYKKKEKVIA